MKRCAFTLVALLAACGGGSSTPLAPATAASTSPSPSPSASGGAGSPAVSTSTLSFVSGAAQNVTVTESGYSGAFTESDTCNPYSGEIASIAAGAKSAGSATYAITPIGAGTCTITFADAAGHTTGVNVTVSTAAITVQ